MAELILTGDPSPIDKAYLLPLSKSVSNRLLILHYLYDIDIDEDHISTAHDTQILRSLLTRPLAAVLDAEDAGTVMRFVTAVCATTSSHHTMVGNHRMYQRPIGPLVKSLQDAGADISYLGEQGYPPLSIGRPKLRSGQWAVDTEMSSQYASALMLIMPTTDTDVSLQLHGAQNSMPYIYMTLELMQRSGFDIQKEKNTIHYSPNPRTPNPPMRSPSDYSALAFQILELASCSGQIRIRSLSPPDGLQGDEVVLDYCPYLGITYQWEGDDLLLYRTKDSPVLPLPGPIDFGNTPDLALPILPALCLHHEEVEIKGIDSLNLKESERWEILQDIVYALGCKVFKKDDYFQIRKVQDAFKKLDIDDQKDHRVVMTLAALSHRFESTKIYHPQSVRKSYPLYWEHFL